MTNPIEYPTDEWSSWVDSMNAIKKELYRLGSKRAIFNVHNEVQKDSPVNDDTASVHHGVSAWLRVKDRSPRPPSGAHATR